jgi:hypothetical protein
MNDQLLEPKQDLEYEFHCATCSDEAIPARVMRIDERSGLAMVELQGTPTEVDISLVDDVEPGDTLLIHGGVALFMHAKYHTDA